jgi:nitrite reductase (NADH) large subunit
MACHVAGYACEWKGVLEDPEKLSRFVSFVNAPDAPDRTVTFTKRDGRIVPEPHASSTTYMGMPNIRR